MFYDEIKRQEMNTIRERKIEIRLSDADCMRIADVSGSCGLTVGEFLSRFIGDLIYGTCCTCDRGNMYANKWFERCGYEYNTEGNMIAYLHEQCEFVEFVELLEDIKFVKECIGRGLEDKQIYEIELDDGLTLKDLETVYDVYVTNFLALYPNADIEQEVKACIEWAKERNKILDYFKEA